MTHFIKIGFSFSNAFSHKSMDFKSYFKKLNIKEKKLDEAVKIEIIKIL
jgi:hypothetical protein